MSLGKPIAYLIHCACLGSVGVHGDGVTGSSSRVLGSEHMGELHLGRRSGVLHSSIQTFLIRPA